MLHEGAFASISMLVLEDRSPMMNCNASTLNSHDDKRHV